MNEAGTADMGLNTDVASVAYVGLDFREHVQLAICHVSPALSTNDNMDTFIYIYM